MTGLPAGVTGNWAANVVTISGTPTASGPFNYTVTLTGGCGTVTANGTITVTPNNTITLTSAAGNNNTDSLYQHSDNEYHVCDHRSNRSNRYRITCRSNRHLGSQCCDYQRNTDSIRTV